MLGIIILNYNTPQQTIECINSIIKYTKTEFEIVLVDNCSTDNSRSIFQREYLNRSHIKLVFSDKNGGYSYGNNLGINACSDNVDAFLILNSDIIFLNDAISEMYYTLKKYSNVAVVGPSIISLDKKESQFMRKKLDFKGYMCEKWPLAAFNIDTGRWIKWSKFENKYNFDGMVSGCCFLIDADVFQKLGYFDTNVFLFGEEDILAHKLSKLSYKSAINDYAKVLHKHSESISKNGKAFLRTYSLTSPLYVLKIYSGVNKIEFAIASIVSIIPFALFSLFKKEYRIQFTKFMKYYFNICKMKVG